MVEVHDTDQTVGPPPIRRRLLVAVVASVLLVSILGALLREDSLLVDPATTEAVAHSFMTAWVEGDGEGVVALFAADGTFGGYAPEVIPALHDWYRAVGQEFSDMGCVLRDADAVSCSYEFENELTRSLGRGPVSGTFQLLQVDDGRIERARGFTDQFSTDGYDVVWGRFIEWVVGEHPEDFDRMYSFGSYPVLHATSISLWERRVGEFVVSPEATPGAFLAWEENRGIREAFLTSAAAICRDATDRLLAGEAALGAAGLTAGTLEYWAAWSDDAARIADESLAELQGLSSPESDRASLDRFYELAEEQNELVRRMGVAAGAGEGELFDRLFNERFEVTRRMHEAHPGLDSCPVDLPG